MIEKTSPESSVSLPQRLGERGFGELARLGKLALKAAQIGDSLIAVSQTGMTPSFAKELLQALEPVARAQQSIQLNADDAKAVVAAFARGEVSHISFDPKQFDAFGKELLALVSGNKAASAVLAFKNFLSVDDNNGVKWSEDAISYWGMNAVSDLTETLREALRAKGVDPDQAGLPLPGPEAM